MPDVRNADAAGGGPQPGARGRAVQVDPIKPTLKAPRTNPLQLKYDTLVSTFAFKFSLRRYNVVAHEIAHSWSGNLAGAEPRPLFGST